MSFMYPWVLILLPLALLFLRKRAMNAIQISSVFGWIGAHCPQRIKWLIIPRILRMLACMLLILAWAGPRKELPINEEIRHGIAMEILIDISSSMDQSITEANGTRQTRMSASKSTVEAFIHNRTNDLIGLITFARYADTLSPLTFGHSALIQLVQDIQIQDRPNEDGTAYGDALMLACAHLDQMNSWNRDGTSTSNQTALIKSKAIILLTDGENNCGLHLPQEAAGLAKKWNIRIYTIALGDATQSDSAFTESEQLLQLISEETGGAFWKIHNIDALKESYAKIDELEKSDIKNTTHLYTEYQPVFYFFAGAALLILLLEWILSTTILRVTEEEIS